jgi:hypothetical protein
MMKDLPYFKCKSRHNMNCPFSSSTSRALPQSLSLLTSDLALQLLVQGNFWGNCGFLTSALHLQPQGFPRTGKRGLWFPPYIPAVHSPWERLLSKELVRGFYFCCHELVLIHHTFSISHLLNAQVVVPLGKWHLCVDLCVHKCKV